MNQAYDLMFIHIINLYFYINIKFKELILFIIMLEILEEYKYKINFNNIICEFIPDIQKEFEYLPEVLNGYVIYILKGEYNPISWKKKITINKKDIIN